MKIKSLTPTTLFFLSILLSMHFRAQSQETDKESGNMKIEIKDVDAQKAMVIKADIPMKEISSKMGEMYGQLFSYLGQNNIKPVGPPFAIYYSFEPEGNVVFECGVPIGDKVEGSESIKYKEFDAMKVVSTLYIGPYEKMEPVYKDLEKYLKDEDIEPTGTSWEIYLTDPNEEEDPNKYQTIIQFPIK